MSQKGECMFTVVKVFARRDRRAAQHSKMRASVMERLRYRETSVLSVFCAYMYMHMYM